MEEPVVIGPRYVSQFSCIGAACEDTCCAGWNVTVDQDAFQRLRSALAGSVAEREAFDAGFTRIRDRPSTKERFALVVLREKTLACRFLSEKRLCGLHARFGEEVLPDTCASFPRRQSSVGARIETSLSLACPEAARKALLAHDALELVDLGPRALSRNDRAQEYSGADDYERSLDPVRQALLGVLAGPGSLQLRLANVVLLAQDLGFAKGQPIDLETSSRTLAELDEAKRHVWVERLFATSRAPLEPSLLALLRLLSRRSTYPDGRFDRLMQHALAAYGIADDARVADVACAFVGRRDAMPAPAGARLEEVLTNYAMNHVFSRWFTAAPSLGVWVRGLVLRVAFARFLAFAHPAIAESGASEVAGTIDRIMVEIISQMSREVDHHVAFVEWLDGHLAEELPDLARTLGLLGI